MNTEDDEFQRIEREATRGVPDAIHHTDTSETLEYITGWNDFRAAMLSAHQGEHISKTVIEMAREVYGQHTEWTDSQLERLKQFAELVRAEAIAAERKACAKVCDSVVEGKHPDDIHSDSQWAALTLAAEIRARKNS